MKRSGFLQAAIIAVFCHAAAAQPAPSAGRNASFLSRRYLTDSRNSPALTGELLRRTGAYGIQMLFPNGGLFDSSGHLATPSPAVTAFLDHVRGAERGTRGTYVVMPYLNAYSLQNTAHPANQRVDLGSRMVRRQMVAECLRYVSARSDGSYIRGARREFDGIVLDIEPAGDPAFFTALKLLLTELRAAFESQGLGNKRIGIAAPQHTDRVPKPNWGWNSSDYYYIGRYVDYVVAMTYDSGVQDAAQYQAWIAAQTTSILRAASGGAWNFDSGHPASRSGAKVLIGLPGFYTLTKAHNPEIENVASGAPGIRQGLARLGSSEQPSLASFLGAAMYAHDTGAMDSPYARYSRDWAWWRQYWLGQ